MSERVLVAENDRRVRASTLLRGRRLRRRHRLRLDARASSRSASATTTAILIRSATKVDADLIARGDEAARRSRRAGVGVDNVDVAAATKRGIIVVNAPQSNVVTAAEHTMALLLALARNIPQAHGALTAGRWERKNFSGIELMDKTLGDPRLRAHRPARRARARKAFGMHVVAYDPFVATERYRDARRREGRHAPTTSTRRPTSSRCTCRTRPRPNGWLNAEAFAKMRDGVRILNVARGSLIVDEDLQAALDSGKVGGAALDVFRAEPITDHPLFGYPNVIVTPHLGASTAEATDRAGYQAAEQIVAALQGGSVTTAVNAPTITRRGPRGARPVPAALPPARPARARRWRCAARSTAIEIECLGRIAERDTRPLGTAVAARRARRPHRGADQRGQRARDRRGARHRGRARREHDRRATSPTSCASRSSAAARRTTRRRHDDRQPQPPAPARRRGASASTSSSSRT